MCSPVALRVLPVFPASFAQPTRACCAVPNSTAPSRPCKIGCMSGALVLRASWRYASASARGVTKTPASPSACARTASGVVEGSTLPEASSAAIRPVRDAKPRPSRSWESSPGANRSAALATKQLQEYASAVSTCIGINSGGCVQSNLRFPMVNRVGQTNDAVEFNFPFRKSAESTKGLAVEPGGAIVLPATILLLIARRRRVRTSRTRAAPRPGSR